MKTSLQRIREIVQRWYDGDKPAGGWTIQHEGDIREIRKILDEDTGESKCLNHHELDESGKIFCKDGDSCAAKKSKNPNKHFAIYPEKHRPKECTCELTQGTTGPLEPSRILDPDCPQHGKNPLPWDSVEKSADDFVKHSKPDQGLRVVANSGPLSKDQANLVNAHLERLEKLEPPKEPDQDRECNCEEHGCKGVVGGKCDCWEDITEKIRPEIDRANNLSKHYFPKEDQDKECQSCSEGYDCEEHGRGWKSMLLCDCKAKTLQSCTCALKGEPHPVVPKKPKQKPSERIKELQKEHGIGEVAAAFLYLDERGP